MSREVQEAVHMYVRKYVNLKLNYTNMDTSLAKYLSKKNYSFQNNEKFFFSLFCTIKKNVLLTLYNFRIVYKNGDLRNFLRLAVYITSIVYDNCLFVKLKIITLKNFDQLFVYM